VLGSNSSTVVSGVGSAQSCMAPASCRWAPACPVVYRMRRWNSTAISPSPDGLPRGQMNALAVRESDREAAAVGERHALPTCYLPRSGHRAGEGEGEPGGRID